MAQIGMNRFLAAAEDDGVAALEAKGRGVAGDVGPALVEEQDHAERHADFLDAQAVGPDEPFDDLPDRIDLCGDLLDALGHRIDALFVELQPLDQGGLHIGQPGRLRRPWRWLQVAPPDHRGWRRPFFSGRRL